MQQTSGAASIPEAGRIAVLFNPIKSQKAVDTYAASVRSRNPSLQVDVLASKSSADVGELARKACREGCDVVVAAWGDGTLLPVINALAHTDVVLASLPLGTGNDLSRSLGIRTVEDAARALTDGMVRALDVGRCSYIGPDGSPAETLFCSTAGVGLLADMSRLERERAAVILKRLLGNAVWPLLTIYSALRFRAFGAEMVLNGRSVQRSLKLFEISNVAHAGGFGFTPWARPDRGIVDAWMLPDVSFWRFFYVFGKVTKGDGKHLSLPDFEYFSAGESPNSLGISELKEIVLETDRPVTLHLQGEPVGQTPARIQVEAGAIKALGLG